MKKKFESEEFRRYREQMHGEEYEDDNTPRNPIKIVFAIFMIIFYIGLGILLLLSSNIFGFAPNLTWVRITMGVILMIYGLWRGYRAYAGIDSRL